MLFDFCSDNHDSKFKALNALEIFRSTFTHYLTIGFENVIFYAVGGKNYYKLYGSVLYIFCNEHGRFQLKTML